jgi:hypothetical protein
VIYTAEHADLDAAVAASCWAAELPEEPDEYPAVVAYAEEQRWEWPSAAPLS